MKNIELQIKRFAKRKSVIAILGKDYKFSKEQHARLERLFIRYKSPKNIEHMLDTVAKFVYYDLTNYVGRLSRLKGILGTSKYTQILRYGRYYKDIYKNQTASKIKHFKNVTQYWINKGYTEIEAKKEVNTVQTDRAKRSALKTTGTSLYSCRSVEFWKSRGYSDIQAQKQVSKIQTTNGLSYYKEKYPNDYEERFQKRIDMWLAAYNANDTDLINLKKSHSITGGLACGLSLEDAELRYNNMIEHMRTIRRKPSKISQKMCEMLFDKLNGTCYYSNNNYEYQIDKYRVDFYHKETNTVVEFYGDYYHQNPNIFDKHHCVHGITAEGRWKYDMLRKETILKSGKVNKFFEVWESDFRKNPTKCVEHIIKEIKK
jgi:very-short-patch-repair endonuclease/CO dehydrogenase/acetyl-CoA synthase epsilon subunit